MPISSVESKETTTSYPPDNNNSLQLDQLLKVDIKLEKNQQPLLSTTKIQNEVKVDLQKESIIKIEDDIYLTTPKSSSACDQHTINLNTRSSNNSTNQKNSTDLLSKLNQIQTIQGIRRIKSGANIVDKFSSKNLATHQKSYKLVNYVEQSKQMGTFFYERRKFAQA